MWDSQHRVIFETDANGNTTQLVYNGPFLGQIHPPAGGSQATRFSYNKWGELTSESTPIGEQAYGYDAYGNRTSTVLEDWKGNPLNGNGTVVRYDEAGNAMASFDPRGTSSLTNPNAAYETTWSYDPASGNLLSMTQPGGNTTTYHYDPAGDLTSVTDPAGNTTSYSWDEGDLVQTVTTTAPGSTSPSTTIQQYDPSGDLLSETNATDQGTTYTYDAAGREVSMTNAANVTVHYTYDIDSNVVAVTDSLGDTVTNQYDSLNRLVRTVNNGAATTTAYDPAGNVASSTDAEGSTTSYSYTQNNLVASVTNPSGTTSYAYDGAGDLLIAKDPDGHVTTYTYDGAGRRTSMTVNGATTTYTYDPASNLASTTDPDGRATTYTLNAADQPTDVTYTWAGHPTIDVSRTYDHLGHLLSTMETSGGAPTYSTTNTYDGSGELTSSTTAAGTFHYDYSHPGQIVETYPDGTQVTYSLDDAQNLMSVQVGTDPASPMYVKASYVRNAARETTAIALSNGVLETDQLDQSGNVLDQSLQKAGSVLANDSFTYDQDGNRLSQTDTVGTNTVTESYGYDATGQLTGFATASSTTAALSGSGPTGSSGPTDSSGPTGAGSSVLGQPATSTSSTSTDSPVSLSASDVTQAGANSAGTNDVNSPPSAAPAYTYDGVGNRLTYGSAGGQTNYTYNAGNELTSATGPQGNTGWTYDKTGDVSSRTGPGGTSTTYTYDAADRLMAVKTTSGGTTTTVNYTYDGNGNLVARTENGQTTQYVWDPLGSFPQLALELDGGGNLIRRYIYGDGPVAMQTPTATYFYHLDPLGSVAEMSDSNGNIVAAYHYDGFGNVVTDGANPPANPLLFQGQYFDSGTGLYYMRARYYDPTVGRFIQRDPSPRRLATPPSRRMCSPATGRRSLPTRRECQP